MLNRIQVTFLRLSSVIRVSSCNFSQFEGSGGANLTESKNLVETPKELVSNDVPDLISKKRSVLEKCTEDISHIGPYLKPTFNLAAYVNKSETLQQLMHMGVNLHRIEQKTNAAQLLLRLDFEKDIKKYVLFFHDLGLTVDDIAHSISKNPYILQQDIDYLKVRVNYLLYKKFSEDGIQRILKRNPFWLMYSTERIDRRLGFFQQEFSLLGDEVRHLACKQPKLITYNINHIKTNIFMLKEEMGFIDTEIKSILLNKPSIFMKNRDKMVATFEYLHNHMEVPLQTIVTFPEVLTCREFRLKQRDLFLKELGKDQYDPTKPNYVSLPALISGENGEFCVNVAKSSIKAFNTFLKTL